MKPLRRGKHDAAFTLKELLVIIAVTFVLVALAFSYAAKAKAYSRKIACTNNLKQIGIPFFANGHGDAFPMKLSTNSGGSMEYATVSEVFRQFRVMSNGLITPKILVCPADNRKAALGFGVLSNANISYFVAAGASDAFPQSLLAGDRNLMTNRVPVGSGLLVLTTNVSVGWTAALHRNSGNVALGDGSVQQFTSARLQEQATHSGVATNRLLIP